MLASNTLVLGPAAGGRIAGVHRFANMVTNDYHMTMYQKTGVAELKARLSEFLRVVKRGGEVTIYDRDQPIARIVPYAEQHSLAVREPLSSYGTLGGIPLPPPAKLSVDPVDLLLQDRQSDR